MLFQYTLDRVLNGSKRQTRRPVKPDDRAVQHDGEIVGVQQHGRDKWRVGKTYAVQPARGKPQVARIRLLKIRRQRVKDISRADAVAEGYETPAQFFETWQQANGAETLDGEAWVLHFELVDDET